MPARLDVLKKLDADTLKVIHDTFADKFKAEIAAEEDLFRTLPFFATALGVGVAGASFAASHMPIDVLACTLSNWIKALALFCILLLLAAGLLVVLCILRLMQAVGARIERVALNEPGLLQWVERTNVRPREGGGPRAANADDIRMRLIANYYNVNRSKRDANLRRRTSRSQAISALLLSFLCSFAATVIIFIAERCAIFC